MSPMIKGTPQADAFRPLRLPVVLVCDSRLGGVSSTISAFESLHMRGYDIHHLVGFRNDPHENDVEVQDYLERYFPGQAKPTFLTLPPVPEQDPDADADLVSMKRYYDNVDGDSATAQHLLDILKHPRRPSRHSSLSTEATRSIWHPFMQHKNRTSNDILEIDSAFGDQFTVQRPSSESTIATDADLPALSTAFDGSASWWTQGLGHGNPVLALAAAHAAGRYGHVMFAGAIHQPALDLAKTMVEELQNPRLKKVFFSDNGSTGIEVAIKMALKTSMKRYGWKNEDRDLEIIGLKNSYHGDTIGAMDCSEPSTFNTKVVS